MSQHFAVLSSYNYFRPLVDIFPREFFLHIIMTDIIYINCIYMYIYYFNIFIITIIIKAEV